MVSYPYVPIDQWHNSQMQAALHQGNTYTKLAIILRIIMLKIENNIQRSAS